MTTVEELTKKLNDLKEKVGIKYAEITFLKRELAETSLLLQSKCEHTFYRERDCDYHKPGYYYICEKCDYMTRFEPKTMKVSKSF